MLKNEEENHASWMTVQRQPASLPEERCPSQLRLLGPGPFDCCSGSRQLTGFRAALKVSETDTRPETANPCTGDLH